MKAGGFASRTTSSSDDKMTRLLSGRESHGPLKIHPLHEAQNHKATWTLPDLANGLRSQIRAVGAENIASRSHRGLPFCIRFRPARPACRGTTITRTKMEAEREQFWIGNCCKPQMTSARQKVIVETELASPADSRHAVPATRC